MDRVDARSRSDVAISVGQRCTALLSLLVGKLLARLRPVRLLPVLRTLARGARPVDHARATELHRRLLAANIAVGRSDACLRRSLALVVSCRLHGTMPTWCLGVQHESPFRAHAWCEAQGRAVGEVVSPDVVATMLTVAPGPPPDRVRPGT
ncbi:lasso peptide biosynthesis B2 protein [Micromonospora cathayae]|uniref:Lasso peptide biosynthesis B2 protein n=1 Tax=Micromonospora cathayae TaxID=3028804 RepID=A0ABY7ZNJ4_9ACTN|nr:lasso peptide biosynthesis B2 protein [Micromonospora sp. HUAS 3]WDZ84590.1 lasso peptide biosynthesis B2 protein [Micromonospora sp. HUAS 3]